MVTVIYSNSRQRGVDTISGMSINLREALQQSTMNLFGPVDPIISTSSFVLCTIGLSKTLHEKWKPSVINHLLKKTTNRKKPRLSWKSSKTRNKYKKNNYKKKNTWTLQNNIIKWYSVHVCGENGTLCIMSSLYINHHNVHRETFPVKNWLWTKFKCSLYVCLVVKCFTFCFELVVNKYITWFLFYYTIFIYISVV